MNIEKHNKTVQVNSHNLLELKRYRITKQKYFFSSLCLKKGRTEQPTKEPSKQRNAKMQLCRNECMGGLIEFKRSNLMHGMDIEILQMSILLKLVQ